MTSVFLAFTLSFLAGAASAVGGLCSFFIKKENLSALAVGLGFSAGVMIYVSFMEILPHAQETLVGLYGHVFGPWLAVGLFFVGVAIAWGVDRCLPPLHVKEETLKQSAKLKQTGLFTALALVLHNFPEGLATFFSALDSVTLGFSIALAVAIHNIPEGIAVALPIYHATGSRQKAFWASAASGMAEPVGAVVGYFILHAVLQGAVLGILFAVVAGIMVYLALDELLPTAHDYGHGHQVISGVVGGMGLMALVLLIF
ncbi:MAG: zinc transporter ZupT [Elusimicrobiaceae bacterium]|nr:zinc transporter ZupT [Elusimicrobiaceae bacterium]